MARKKMSPHVLKEGQYKQPNSFIYRLISNQRFLAIIGLFFLLIIVLPLAKTYSQRRLIEREIEEIKEEIVEFENKNQELKEIISYLESDQSLEEQARLGLNMQKPGEQVIVVNNKTGQVKEVNTGKLAEQKSNFIKWWNYFFQQ